MKVLLLYPNIHGMNMLPPAIGLFSALLKRNGHLVELFDSTTWIIPGEDFDSDKEKERILTARPFDDSKLRSEMHASDVFSDFRSKVLSVAPDLIAVSVTEDIFPVGIRLLRAISDLKIPTILGGVFATFAPEKCLAFDEVSMVCLGEGETLLVELCDRMERGVAIENIPGLWVKTPQGLRKNPMGPPVDMDQNPLLDLSLFEESRLYRPMQGRVWRMLPVETHRGCPYKCTYCNSPAQQRLYRGTTQSRHYRKKSFEAIHRELEHFKQVVKAEAFYFWADTFLSYTDREFDEFCEMYSDIALPFWVQSRPETIREDRLAKLQRLGMFRMAFGVEHGNDAFRKSVLRRNVSNAVMLEKFEILYKLDIKFSINNIIGFPTETRELAMDTVLLASKIKADSANAYSYSPFHGTRLRKMAEDFGYCSRDTIDRSVMKPTLLNMPQFPPAAIEGLRRCFTLYIRMPQSRWPDIRKAEQLTAEGDTLLQELRDECQEKYMNYD